MLGATVSHILNPFSKTYRTVFHIKTDDHSCHLIMANKNFQIKPDNLKKLHVEKFINMDLTLEQYSQATCG